MAERSSKKKWKRPADINRLAKLIVDEATGQSEKQAIDQPEEPIRGQSGGRVGGKARAAKLTAEERTEIARKAAQARWKKKRSAE